MSYVYALINPAVPGRVKVGQTTCQPEERLKEINSGAGVAGRWRIVKPVAVQAGRTQGRAGGSHDPAALSR
jgi:hypothetical protein